MLTRIEIDGFKTFEHFSLDLQPFTAIVGPNASGKSNLFDALRFLSLLAQVDIRTAMQDLRGLPRNYSDRLQLRAPIACLSQSKCCLSVGVQMPSGGRTKFRLKGSDTN
uniref:AAA family ATPase n=1 Tax=Phenylobacterium glaciei TaxID=2803784 RepID=A0A974P310_9CAUL|nr:AAA family ATPase [Phenylobacterium glaciei]